MECDQTDAQFHQRIDARTSGPAFVLAGKISRPDTTAVCSSSGNNGWIVQYVYVLPPDTKEDENDEKKVRRNSDDFVDRAGAV